MQRQHQIDTLRECGYVVLHRCALQDELAHLNDRARAQLAECAAPVEFEADLRYPGAPSSRSAAGGGTVRRLLDAYARDPAFAAFATAPHIGAWMHAYFGGDVLMSRAHHNCLMTKHPRYGSLTGWHRDVRYWSFEHEELVSVWLALGPEEASNGALWFVPGSHTAEIGDSQFDAAKFLRTDSTDSAGLVASARSPELEPGDAVIFHARTLHSAGQNASAAIKYSLAFTYHARSNAPIAGSRSASKAEVGM